MAKKYMNNLTKIGTQIAFAAAMTAALAMPANADEIEETPAPQPESTPVVADPAPAATSSDVQEVSSYNETVSESNDQAVSDNNDTAVGNEFTGSDNESAAAENESVPSGNETGDNGNETIDNGNQEAIEGNEDLTTDLPDAPEAPDVPEAPELPDIPEIPEAPETPDLDDTNTDDYNNGVDGYNGQVDDYNEDAEDYNEAVGDYNEAVGDYNEAVGSYNEAVGGYNGAVEDYNEAVDGINQQLQDQYDAAHDQWEQDKTENEQAHAEYTEKETDYKQAEAEYLAAKKAYEDAYDLWKDEYDAWEQRKNNYIIENGTEEEFDALKQAYDKAYNEWEAECTRLNNDYLAKKALYEQYLKDQAAYEKYEDDLDTYEKDKEVYDQLVTENKIYGDVLKYNDQVQKDNDAVQEQNKLLTSDLDTGAVANLEVLEEEKLNTKLNEELAKTEEGKALLTTLGKDNRKALAKAEENLAERAAALDAEAENKYTLGSPEYADYLARVKQFNDDVATHNANLAAYNAAVEEYNKRVDAFNDANEPVAGDASTDNAYTEGNADWGNIVVTQTDRKGNVTNKELDHIDVKYQAASSKTVTTDENGENPVYSENVTGYKVTGVYANENTTKYSVSYDANGSAAGGTGTQSLTKDSGNAEFGGPHGGRIGFDPLNGTVSFYVTLEDTAGQKYGINVTLDDTTTFAEGSYYKAESNDLLKYYKDSNGNRLETVTIDGKEYFNVSGQSVFVISALTCEGSSGNYNSINLSSMSGLDLVLNLQTMIKVHQADNAQKIVYQGGYLEGKLAYAEKPDSPGDEPVKPEEVQKPDKVDEPTLVLPDPPDLEDPGDEYIPFGEEAPTPPTDDYKKLDPGKFEEQKPGDFTDPEPQLVQLSHLKTIQELNTMDVLKPIDYLENKLDYKMILVIPEAPQETPDPIVIDTPTPTPTPVVARRVVLQETMDIVDEAIPLAKAPKTGDISSIWAVLSGLSLGGMSLLNRKRKEEE